MTFRLADDDRTILQFVRREPKSTPEISGLLGKNAYARCRRLEAQGLLQSVLGSKPGVFCAECGLPVTRENRADHEGHELRTIKINVRSWVGTERARGIIGGSP